MFNSIFGNNEIIQIIIERILWIYSFMKNYILLKIILLLLSNITVFIIIWDINSSASKLQEIISSINSNRRQCALSILQRASNEIICPFGANSNQQIVRCWLLFLRW